MICTQNRHLTINVRVFFFFLNVIIKLYFLRMKVFSSLSKRTIPNNVCIHYCYRSDRETKRKTEH